MTAQNAPKVKTAHCRRCGLDWEWTVRQGAVPVLCEGCKALPATALSFEQGYSLGLRLTEYRLAIDEAATALRLGRPAVALAALDRVATPGEHQRIRLPDQHADSLDLRDETLQP